MEKRSLFEDIKEGFNSLEERDRAIREARKAGKPRSKRPRIAYALFDGVFFAVGHIFTVAAFLFVLYLISR